MIKYHHYYIYILCNKPNGVLYLGVTNNLVKRVWEHKNKVFRGFSAKYNVDKLVYYEMMENINVAIYREKCIKEWKREWKLKMINDFNPDWIDLYDEMSKNAYS